MGILSAPNITPYKRLTAAVAPATNLKQGTKVALHVLPSLGPLDVPADQDGSLTKTRAWAMSPTIYP